ncbi:MAG TPA: thiamine phosphate synthase [Acidiferrobacterales bacterium]
MTDRSAGGGRRVAGLYAIADPGCLAAESLPAAVEQALAGGAALIQYRDKLSDAGTRRRLAERLAELCRRLGAPFIVNDDPDLAAAVGADGVHLGRDDPDLASARRALGPRALIGVSCYNDLARAEAATALGADYVAFGSFYASGVKPQAVRAEPELLRAAKRRIAVPLVAIGGITPENGAALIDAGAGALAVISGVFAAADVRAAAARYAALFADEKL